MEKLPLNVLLHVETSSKALRKQKAAFSMILRVLWNIPDKDWKSSGCDKIRKSNADSDLINVLWEF